VKASDNAQVKVASFLPPQTPRISITKNPKQQTISSGNAANFSITVTNTGTVTLTNVTIVDPLAPDCSKTGAGIPDLLSMAVGASVTYNCSLQNVTASFTNVATASGTGNGQTVTATDSAPVTVTPPFTPPPPPTPPVKPAPKAQISIAKDPNSQTIGKGGTATCKIKVTNSGNAVLTNVTVSDPQSPSCNRALGTLAVGQSKSYTCTRKNVSADFQNVATATGKPPTGADVKASDNAQVKVASFLPPQTPRISITTSPKKQSLTTNLKTTTGADGAKSSSVSYGTAHFSIKVTNSGNVALHDVKVSDPETPSCTHKIGTLAPGQSISYPCERTAVSRDFRNVATATGVSPKGKKVRAVDHADVKVNVKTTGSSGAHFTG
jgi:uncharacterized repeat protein (TIGR01451 family)